MQYLPVCVLRHVQHLSDEEQTHDPHWWVTWLYVQISHAVCSITAQSWFICDVMLILGCTTIFFFYVHSLHLN